MKAHLIGVIALIFCSVLPMRSHRPSALRMEKMNYEGKMLERIKLSNKNGMYICVTNFAASLTDVFAPGRNGRFGHVVLGFDSLSPYLERHPKFGATVGRYANRIKDAELILLGDTFHLDKNNKTHCIHGGARGFNTRTFHTDTCYATKNESVAVFSYDSPDGEGGFPGNLHVSVSYKLTDENEIVIDYSATTDRTTVVNLTNHSYFNLSGNGDSVVDYSYEIYADSITQVGADGIPTGKLVAVAETEFDFRHPRSVARKVQDTGKGYDVNYRLRKRAGALDLAAVVADSVSGRVLKAYTTEPGMQFYVPHSDMSYLLGHDGVRYGKFCGFCLEMQHFPDSPHHPQFPSTILRPGETYRQTTIYKFEVM